MQKLRWDEIAGAIRRWTASGWAVVTLASTSITGNIPLAQLVEASTSVAGSGTLVPVAGRFISVIASAAGAQGVTLPTIAACGGAGAVLMVRKTGSAGAVTLTAGGTDTIAGGATHAALDAQNDWAIFTAVGTDWVLGPNAIA